jgi:hypothetical protein
MDAITARTSLRLLSCESKSAEKTAIQRIRRKMTNGRRPCKECETPINCKRKWLEKKVGNIERLKTRQSYYIPLWKPPLDVRIAPSKEEAEKHHEANKYTTRRRIYTDGSGLNNRVTAAAVTPYSYTVSQLKYTGNIQIYHRKLLNIALALQQKAASYKTNSITIYSDN